jgi:hypothetical protein
MAGVRTEQLGFVSLRPKAWHDRPAVSGGTTWARRGIWIAVRKDPAGGRRLLCRRLRCFVIPQRRIPCPVWEARHVLRPIGRALRSRRYRRSGDRQNVMQGCEPQPSPPRDWFGRCRATPIRSLTAQQAALHAALVIHSGIADLRSAPLAGSDIARETAAMRQVVIDLAGSGDDSQHNIELDNAAIDLVPAHTQQQVWLSRWIIGHHVHVLFNVYAAIALRDTIRLLRAGTVHAAADQLARATTYVQGFAAARAHAATLPADFYNEVVRPTMVPTVVPVPLSGSMHVEYQMYREKVNELLTVLPEPVNELALREPGLAFAREALLEADLIEAERHVCLVEPVVGNLRSLIQPPRSTENAVAVLRLMRHRRAAQFEPFLRFGDHLVAGQANQPENDTNGRPRQRNACDGTRLN